MNNSVINIEVLKAYLVWSMKSGPKRHTKDVIRWCPIQLVVLKLNNIDGHQEKTLARLVYHGFLNKIKIEVKFLGG